jgi:aspartate carbamoyltransferase catalytic subunit
MLKKPEHVLSISQFLDRKKLAEVFRIASEMEKRDKTGKLGRPLEGKILATIFYEPSTRTRLSFEAAMLKLGGSVISTENASQFSSAIKGESIEDTMRIASGYADAIVIRHPEIGSAARAASSALVPVINAGDGAGEHPTQTLLDAYTITKERGELNNLHITFVGDLLYGRTVHSLPVLLAEYNNVTMDFVSAKELRLPDAYKKKLVAKKIKFQEYTELSKVAGSADVIYMTRVQKERFASLAKYRKVAGLYEMNEAVLRLCKKDAMILHPLPRVTEISPEIDADPRAAYFRQAKNGLYVRMALLTMLIGKK